MYEARYTVLSVTSTIHTDQKVLVELEVHNDSNAIWEHSKDNPVNLSYHWLDENHQIVHYDGVRTEFQTPLKPGASRKFELVIDAPEAGKYLLAIDLVHEGIGWFSQLGTSYQAIPIEVREVPVSQPRACLVVSALLLHDAVGKQVLDQKSVLEAQGYRVDLIVEVVDPRIPFMERQSITTIRYADLVGIEDKPYYRQVRARFYAADLYIFHFPIYYELFDVIPTIQQGVILVDYHGFTPANLWVQDGQAFKDLQKSREKLELLKYVDYVIVHSDFARRELQQHCTYPTEQIMILPLPVETERFRRKQATQQDRWSNQLTMLYVGRIAGNKRVDLLVKALYEVRKVFPNTVLLLAGDNKTPPYKSIFESVSELIASLNLQDAVHWLGQVSDQELLELYHRADVFVTASLHEGFCVPLVEAMACGTPVIGSNITAIPETIGDGGLSFDPEQYQDLAEHVIRIFESKEI